MMYLLISLLDVASNDVCLLSLGLKHWEKSMRSDAQFTPTQFMQLNYLNGSISQRVGQNPTLKKLEKSELHWGLLR